MVTIVFDTSAIIRFLDGEAGAQRVKTLLRDADRSRCNASISAVNWGEVIYSMNRRHGHQAASQIEARLRAHALTIVPADADRCARAGLLKLKYNIAYADAFGVELASDSPDHILLTADFGAKPAEQAVSIEFLPAKPTL